MPAAQYTSNGFPPACPPPGRERKKSSALSDTTATTPAQINLLPVMMISRLNRQHIPRTEKNAIFLFSLMRTFPVKYARGLENGTPNVFISGDFRNNAADKRAIPTILGRRHKGKRYGGKRNLASKIFRLISGTRRYTHTSSLNPFASGAKPAFAGPTILVDSGVVFFRRKQYSFQDRYGEN
jgi:hypothetical protein